jgi:DAK2 domain fusion protein YloV
MLRDGILSASQCLGFHKGEVDALNVFPVPDGDTGTNMSMTMTAAAREVSLLGDENGFGATAERIASAMLRGARGNSGVILSLVFRGFAGGVKGEKHVGGAVLADALSRGSDAAYKAVMKPTEGTILTVVREASRKAKEAAQNKANDAVAVWSAALQAAREALAATPNFLPVLRQAGVVDAGGQGFVYIMEGLLTGFMGKEASELDLPVILDEPFRKERKGPAALNPDEITYAYCTEFLVERTADAAESDTDKLRKKLGEFGDCVVVVDDAEIVKVHVHSNQPGTVLNLAQPYGQFIEMKIENMRKQHAQMGAGSAAQEPGIVPATKKFGIVAVAAGDGLATLLQELGVDEVVSGGQSMNPSTEDLLRAIHRVPAEHVFVLPNNKNIIMAAEQTETLTSRGVSVVHTRSVPQGVAAVLEFDPGAGIETNHVQMQRAAERVQTGLVTYAARESNIDGLEIKKGSVIGLENGKLTVTETEPVTAAYRVARHLVRHHNGSMVTVYPGEDVTEAQTQQLLDMLEKRYNGNVEVSAAQGGQPLYYYMIAVE